MSILNLLSKNKMPDFKIMFVKAYWYCTINKDEIFINLAVDNQERSPSWFYINNGCKQSTI